MIEGLEVLRAQGHFVNSERVAIISKGKNALEELMKIKNEYKSKTIKQLEKQS